MNARSGSRAVELCAAVFVKDTQTERVEGRVLDLSVHGCLVESSVSVKAGNHLQLWLLLPDQQPALYVSVAAVRWVKGLRFGVEFISMEGLERHRLNRFVAQRLPQEQDTGG